MFSRIVAVALAVSVALLLPAEVNTAKRMKPRFTVKVVERTYRSKSSISLPDTNVESSYPDAIAVRAPRDSRVVDVNLHLDGLSQRRTAAPTWS